MLQPGRDRHQDRRPGQRGPKAGDDEKRNAMKDIASLKLYARVARLGSFSAAARECGLSQSQVSRIIADLERDLKARLLTRSTRAVVLTDTGTEFLARIEPILLALEEAEASVHEEGQIRGAVRMSMPGSVALREVIPRLAPFIADHPTLKIQIVMGDRQQDLVKDAVDLAIRLGQLVDSSATATLITKVRRVIVASPAYLQAHGTPSNPEMLLQHRIVGGPASVVPSAWKFRRGPEQVHVDLEPNFAVSENEGAVAAATAGLGITSTSEWACKRELDAETLVALFDDWSTVDIPVHAYFPMGKATRRAGRAVADYLIAAFRDSP